MPSVTEFLFHSAFITYSSTLCLIATSSITYLLLLPMLLTSILFLLLLLLIVLTNCHTLFRHARQPRKLSSKLAISFFHSLYFKEMVISAVGRNWSLVSLYYTVLFYLSAATLYAVSADAACLLVLVVVYLAAKMIENFDDDPQPYCYGYDTDDEYDNEYDDDDDDCDNDDAGSSSGSHGEIEEDRNPRTKNDDWVHVADPRPSWDRFID